MTIHVSNVTDDEVQTALRLLFARFPIEEQQPRIEEALRAASRGRLNFKDLLIAKEDALPVGAALSYQQPDGISLVWPPVITCQASNISGVEDALMAQVCRHLQRPTE